MAYIKEIRFAHVGRKEGCLCDRCGQYIQNIVTVEFTDGITFRYGQDCFKKLQDHSRLSDFGKKLMRKAMKSIETHSRQLEQYKSGKMTAETDDSWKCFELDWNRDCYWGQHHDDYEAYRRWMIEEWFPERFKEDQKQIERFAKVKFDRDWVEE